MSLLDYMVQVISGRLRDFASKRRRWSTGPSMSEKCYENLYDEHARQLPSDISIGDGNFDLIGRIELGILLNEGLSEQHTLVDFGCGSGRLAVHVIPRMPNGHYIGTDISDFMIHSAQKRLAAIQTCGSCRVSFLKQPLDIFPLDNDSVDMMCAFSVFTHMEHEDSFRYLKDAKRVIRPGGKFIFSCLPVNLSVSKDVFLSSADLPFAERWRHVRNVITSIEMMEALAHLSGWAVERLKICFFFILHY